GLRRVDLGWTLVAGTLLAIDFGFWIAATQLTTIANSLILANLAPVWVLLLAACRLRRRPCTRDLQIVTLSVAGAAIVTGGGFAAFTGAADLGNLLAIVSSIPAAAFLVVSATAPRHLPMPVYLVLAWSWATALLLMADLAVGAAWPTGHDALLAILAMGILAQLLGHGLLTWSLRWLSPCYVAVCCLAEPLLGGLLGVLYFQDQIGAEALAGGLLILLAIYLGARVERPGAG
ncbi:MAG: DMT family transporter, partial [Geminicoccaceae bacterium]